MGAICSIRTFRFERVKQNNQFFTCMFAFSHQMIPYIAVGLSVSRVHQHYNYSNRICCSQLCVLSYPYGGKKHPRPRDQLILNTNNSIDETPSTNIHDTHTRFIVSSIAGQRSGVPTMKSDFIFLLLGLFGVLECQTQPGSASTNPVYILPMDPFSNPYYAPFLASYSNSNPLRPLANGLAGNHAYAYAPPNNFENGYVPSGIYPMPSYGSVPAGPYGSTMPMVHSNAVQAGYSNAYSRPAYPATYEFQTTQSAPNIPMSGYGATSPLFSGFSFMETSSKKLPNDDLLKPLEFLEGVSEEMAGKIDTLLGPLVKSRKEDRMTASLQNKPHSSPTTNGHLL